MSSGENDIIQMHVCKFAIKIYNKQANQQNRQHTSKISQQRIVRPFILTSTPTYSVLAFQPFKVDNISITLKMGSMKTTSPTSIKISGFVVYNIKYSHTINVTAKSFSNYVCLHVCIQSSLGLNISTYFNCCHLETYKLYCAYSCNITPPGRAITMTILPFRL